MRIGQTAENLVSKSVGNSANGPKTLPGNAAASSAQAATQTPRSAGVAVTMSNVARGLDKVARSDASGDFDTDKVAAMKLAIESGSFSVNAEAIADRLLADARDMLDRTTQ